jgi:hypothetical protein
VGLDYVLGARRYLAAFSDVRAVLGSDVQFDTWLFQRKLPVVVEGSQSCAVVLSPAGSWTAPNSHNTARFPRLQVEIYADPQRDSGRNVTVDDTWPKILAAYEALDRHLHMAGTADVMWDSVRVLRSTRLDEPDPVPVNDTDGVQRAAIFYALGLG